MNWQPIETAPKDGTPVLVSFANSIGIGIYNENVPFKYELCSVAHETWGESIKLGMPVTHWMSLPDPVKPMKKDA